jgi:hypothetical protein
MKTTKKTVQQRLSVSDKAFFKVDKAIIKHLGNANAAIILSGLISKYSYFEKRNKLEDDSFFNTKEMIMNDTGLSEESILRAEKLLEDKGYIKTKLKGLPRRKYYTLQWDFINNILQGIVTTECSIYDQQDVVNVTGGTQVHNQHNVVYVTGGTQVAQPTECSIRTLQNISGNENKLTKIKNKNRITKLTNNTLDNIDDKTISYYINLIKNKCIKSWKVLSKECPEIQRDHKLSIYFQKFNYNICLAS